MTRPIHHVIFGPACNTIGSYGDRQSCYFDATKILKSRTVTIVSGPLAESTAAGVLSRMRHWVTVLLVVCVVFLHLHGALGKRKPNIIIFFVDDVSGSLSNDSAQPVICYLDKLR